MNKKYILAALLAFLGACAFAASDSKSESGDNRPRILVTNDDGYSTAGIAALAEELAAFADVVVIAPLDNQSGASQSVKALVSADPIRLEKVAIGDRLHGFAVKGSPADSVFIGIEVLGKDRPFDLVVSGINHGPNPGTAYYYSGTVGAAFQAQSQGVPAIAVSQATNRGEFRTAARFTARVAQRLLSNPLADGVVVSINVPNGNIKGAVAVPPGELPWNIELLPIESLESGVAYHAKLVRGDDEQRSGDAKAYFDGFITVTPLQLDRSHVESLEELAEWDFVALPLQ